MDGKAIDALRCIGESPEPKRHRPHSELSGKRGALLRGDDKRHWIEAGRSYERLALQAVALDLRTEFINQPVEVPALRSRTWLCESVAAPGLRDRCVGQWSRFLFDGDMADPLRSLA